MGLWNKLKQEFIDIIEWVDDTNDTIVYKFPRYQNEIKNGAKLTVRESQVAVFINEGQIADVFQPGMYSLTTQNLPILSTLRGWKYGFDSPFKVDVFFVSTKQFTDQKWGTKNPFIMNDERFGMVEVRAFGNFNYRVTDAARFLKEIAGTDQRFTTEEINGNLRTLIVRKFSDMSGESKFPIEMFVSNLDELSELGQQKMNDYFTSLGLTITMFNIENVSMPDELKKEIFEYSRLNKIDMQKLAQMKMAQSIEKAAENQGLGGAGVGMGFGFGMGNMIGNNMNNMMNTPPAPPPVVQFFIAVNGQQTGPFTMEQLTQMAAQGNFKAESLVWKAGMQGWMAASAVPELSPVLGSVPPPPPPPIP
jgi:membrane protease subunit (stomatin/prohibitin family)